jgi:hypothetical protein
LETFKVGADRPKFGPGKVKSSAKNCRAIELDMRSNAKRAVDQVEKNEIDVSKVCEGATLIDENPPIGILTYNMMTEAFYMIVLDIKYYYTEANIIIGIMLLLVTKVREFGRK